MKPVLKPNQQIKKLIQNPKLTTPDNCFGKNEEKNFKLKNSAAQDNTSFEKALANPSWAALGGGGEEVSLKNKHSGPGLGLSLQVGFSLETGAPL
jgi:hypothetical protein